MNIKLINNNNNKIDRINLIFNKKHNKLIINIIMLDQNLTNLKTN